MDERDFLYVVTTDKAFDDAVVSVLQAIEKKGWTVFGIYDVRERLAAKGFKQQPLKIIEFCNAKAAHAMLSQNRLVSACMPCRINVLQEIDGVHLVAMRPSAMTGFFQGLDAQAAQVVENDVRQIMDDAR
ncbi:DUF302 domain-containing protein [Candidatus Micrarchaeota archaeon]|nr:DUF302 domain-containing protein [Candidatus Micrarchaeota archaeon]